jgi:hypothetical protein
MAELGLRYDYEAALAEMKAGAVTAQQRMAKAATGAMRDLAKLIQTRGRAEIASGGFGKRWQTAFFVRAKPRVGWSLKPTMRGYLKGSLPQIMNIFERGGTIHPKGTWMWVPLPSAPQKIGRKRMTPKIYNAQIGPLQFVHPPGKAPLLLGQVTGNAAGKLTAGRLRTGALHAAVRGGRASFAKGRGKGRRTVSVPIFVGIKTAKVADRLDVDRVYREAARELPRLYLDRMRKQAS